MNFFIGYEDEKHISVGIFGTTKHNEVLKDIKEFYEKEIWEKPVWTIPKIFTYTFEKKYNLSEKRENLLEDGKIVIFPKEYFYPFSNEYIFFLIFFIIYWNFISIKETCF